MKTLNQKEALRSYLTAWQALELTLIEDRKLCKELGVHRNTSLRWRTQRLLPFIRISQKVYYRMTDVLVFLDKKSKKSGSPQLVETRFIASNNRVRT